MTKITHSMLAVLLRFLDYAEGWRLFPRAFKVFLQAFKSSEVAQGLQAIRALGSQSLDKDGIKYLHAYVWLFENALRVVRLSLDRREPCRILDLGCGPGYFLVLARMLGHFAYGINIGDHAIYTQLNDAFENKIFWHRITNEEPHRIDVPQGHFDIVTAFSVTFNRSGIYPSCRLWGLSEWKVFLSKLRDSVKVNGVVAFQLNVKTVAGCCGTEFPIFRSEQLCNTGFACITRGRRTVRLVAIDENVER